MSNEMSEKAKILSELTPEQYEELKMLMLECRRKGLFIQKAELKKKLLREFDDYSQMNIEYSDIIEIINKVFSEREKE